MKTLVLLLALQDADEIQKWIEKLGADYLEEREEARRKLAEAGKKAEDPLIGALEHTDYRVRRAALELLVAMKSTKAVKQIAEIFRNLDEDRSVRASAFTYLQGAGKEAEEVLIEALESDDRDFRLGAVQTLKQIKSEKCAEKIADLYDREQEKDIKDAAFDCLKNIGKPAQPFLLKLLTSMDATVRSGAIDGLTNINRERKDPEVVEKIGSLFVVETDQGSLNNAYGFLASCGEAAQKFFVAGVRGGAGVPVRLKSLEGLTQLKSDAGIDAAADLFEKDPSDEIRLKSKDYLELFGTRVEEHFIRALDNETARVKLLAIEALGKIGSDKPLARISKMFREDKDAEVHKRAFEYLRAIGLKAEDDLIFALGDADKTIKLDAVASLGRSKSEKAIPALLELLSAMDAKLKEAAVDALVRIGPKAIEKVEAAKSAGTVNRKDADQILGLYYREEVERVLARLVSDEGGVGFYEGMFEELKGFGKERAVPVLISIVKDRAYETRLLDREWKGTRDRFSRSLRELSIMALGDFGDAAAVEPLEEVLRETPMLTTDDEYGELVVSLYKLGAKKHLDKYVQTLEREAEVALGGEYKEDGFGKLFSIGLVQNRVGERGKAEKVYLRLIELVEKHKKEKDSDVYAAGLYNVACLLALRGDKPSAIQYLRRAVVAGFKDRSWIAMDKDLTTLRGEEEYKKIMADEGLFKEKQD